MSRYLDLAVRLTDTQLARFEDRERGGFYSTAAGETRLVLRMKDEYDGAEPSGNSVSAMNLLRLAEITDRSSYREAAARTLRAFASHMRVAPIAVPQMLASLAYSTGRHRQIVLVGDKEAEDTRAMVREVHHRFLPDKTVLLVDNERVAGALGGLPAVYCRHAPYRRRRHRLRLRELHLRPADRRPQEIYRAAKALIRVRSGIMALTQPIESIFLEGQWNARVQ